MTGMARRLIQVLLAAFSIAVFTTGARAQVTPPGTTYDPAIPTVEAVLGAPSGERITTSSDVIRYLRALEAAAPGRIVVRPYARSWQNRELVYVVVGSPANIAGLETFSADMRRLADPRTLGRGEADALIDRLPAAVWLGHGVHGDEISSPDAAMAVAYHLLAARNDPTVEQVLANTLVFIDPVQNPDGRDRFVNGYYDTLGLEPAGERIAAERDQPWPGGRVNHYLFDMNRDWFALTQPETRGRVDAFLRYMPVIFVDLHEMSSESTYFFSPEAEPYNPYITRGQREALQLIGRNNARWFDRYGIRYFTREVYDAFYPGYGAGWPLFHGTIGTTYEQASARGLLARRADGDELAFSTSVRNHVAASLATLETAAANRERLLREFHGYRLSAIEDGRRGAVRSYVIPRQADQSGADRLARLLARQGVEVGEAESALRACGKSYPAGSYLVRLDQPAGRLVRTLLEPQIDLDPAFMAEQERRRAKGLEVELYDVTAWSLPLMFNLDIDRCAAATGETRPVDPAAPAPGVIERPDAAWGFLAPWGSTASVRLLAAALRDGLRVWSPDEAFTVGGASYPAGTLVFARAGNPADLPVRLSRLAAETGARVVGLDDAWVTDGPGFGSQRVAVHPAPRIALAWDRPTSPNSAGAARYVIERQFGYPVTPVRTRNLGSSELSRFDVLILPDGNYAGALGERESKALAAWVEAGGVLIALEGAVRYVGDPKSGLSALRRENAVREEPAKAPADEEDEAATVDGVEIRTAEALAELEAPLTAPPDYSPGALVRAAPDPDHWLAAGLKPQLHVLAEGSDIYAPLKRDQGANVIRFEAPDRLLASGYIWEDVRRQLAFKPFLTAEPRGAGFVIAFTQSPTLRGYMDGLNLALANALFRAPAHARPPR
jgi:hypothetical protein